MLAPLRSTVFTIARMMTSGYSPTPRPQKLFWYQRCALIAAGSILLTLLIMSIWLAPDPRGIGTHEQLGLPPCTIRQVWGIRCPACGMTTSWAYFVRGQWFQAARTNLGGTALAMLSALLAPWAMVSGLHGRWWGEPIGEKLAVAVGLVVVAVTLIDWGIRLLLDGS